MKKLKMIKCNLCLIDDTEIVFIEGNYIVVKCKNCGLIYTNPQPEEEERPQFFTEENIKKSITYQKKMKEFYIEGHIPLYKWVLNRLHRFTKTNKKILDIGSGLGVFLKLSQEYGWEPYGVDIAEGGVKYAKEVYGLKNVFRGTLEQSEFQLNYFDVITLFDVLEHITDPLSLLGKVRLYLKENGVVFIHVPNINFTLKRAHIKRKIFKKDFDLLIPETHLYHFSQSTIKKMLKKAGFKNIKIEIPEPIHYTRHKHKLLLIILIRFFCWFTRVLFLVSKQSINLSPEIAVWATK